MASEEGTRTSILGPVLAVLAAGMVVLIIINPFGGDDASSQGTGGSADGAFADFSFTTVDGETTNLAEYAGAPLVVNYFAAWCPPCRAEIPAFQTVADDLDGDVAFVGISRDSDHDAWQSFVDETGMRYPSVFEGQTAGSFEAFNGLGMPTTLLIRADGTVAESHAGALTEAALRDLIKEHLRG